MSALPGSEAADATAAGVVAQMAAFAAAVRGRTVDLPGARASARATAVAEAVRRAADTAATVDLPPDAGASPEPAGAAG
jgi:hypothetical protein